MAFREQLASVIKKRKKKKAPNEDSTSSMNDGIEILTRIPAVPLSFVQVSPSSSTAPSSEVQRDPLGIFASPPPVSSSSPPSRSSQASSSSKRRKPEHKSSKMNVAATKDEDNKEEQNEDAEAWPDRCNRLRRVWRGVRGSKFYDENEQRLSIDASNSSAAVVKVETAATANATASVGVSMRLTGFDVQDLVVSAALGYPLPPWLANSVIGTYDEEQIASEAKRERAHSARRLSRSWARFVMNRRASSLPLPLKIFRLPFQG